MARNSNKANCDIKRLHNSNPLSNKNTGSWSDADTVDKETNLKIRGDYRVEDAKDWVDNGSRL